MALHVEKKKKKKGTGRSESVEYATEKVKDQ